MGAFLSALAQYGPQIAQVGGSLFSALTGGRSKNDQNALLERILGQMTGAADYYRGQGLSNPQDLFYSYSNPVYDTSRNFLASNPDFLSQLLSGNSSYISNYLNNIPSILSASSPASIYSGALKDIGAMYDPLTIMAQQYAQQQPDAYGPVLDRLNEMSLGQYGPLASMLGAGTSALDRGGSTAWNENAGNVSGAGLSAAGVTPLSQMMQDYGSALFGSGGMNSGLTALQNLALGASSLGPGGSGRLTQNDVLGGLGTAAAGNLLGGLQNYATPGATGGLSSTSMQQGWDLPLALASQGYAGPGQYTSPTFQLPQYSQGDTGYTAQNSAMGSQGWQGLQDLLGQSGNFQNAVDAAQQAFSGNLPGGDRYGDAALAAVNSLMSGLSGFSLPGVSGGGASGAGAGTVGTNADLDYMRTFNPRSMQEAVSDAIDQAASGSKNRAEAAARYAQTHGGGGSIVGSGIANRAMQNFADQELQAEAAARRDAAAKQENILQNWASARGQIGANLEGQQTQRDIASANNATAASQTNASTGTQAGIANQQAQLALLQAQLTGKTAGLNALTNLRGQNYDYSTNALNTLKGLQDTANNRGAIFSDAQKAALADASSRYGVSENAATSRYNSILNALANNYSADVAGGTSRANAQTAANAQNYGNQLNTLGILPGLASSNVGLGNTAAQYNLGANQITSGNNQAALTAAIQASLGGQTASNNLLSTLANLGLGTQQIASGNVGMGLGALNNAGQLNSNMFGQYANLGLGASQDQTNRMGLGSTLTNNGINNYLAGLNQYGNTIGQRTNNVGGALTNFGNTASGQGNIWNMLFNQNMQGNQFDLNRATGISNIYNGAISNTMLPFMNNSTSMYTSMMNPLSSLASGVLGYMGGQQSNAANLYGNMYRVMGGYNNTNPYGQFGQSMINAIPGLSQIMRGGAYGGGGGATGNFGGYNPYEGLPSDVSGSWGGILGSWGMGG